LIAQQKQTGKPKKSADAMAAGRRKFSMNRHREAHFMARIGIFYGSTTGRTRFAAEAIQREFGVEADLFDVAGADAADLARYSLLILGVSTWGIGDLQQDWDTRINLLWKVDFSGKKVAFFGLGDAMNYPDSFLDAMGTLFQAVSGRGAECVGRWPVGGYEFTLSSAVVEGEFVGLGLDDDNQGHLSAERISRWVAQVKNEAGV
jgi:flavodoxin I